MAQITHRALRTLIEDFAYCDEYYSEMISAEGLLCGGPWEKYYIDGGPNPQKLVYQICSGNACSLAKAAAMLDNYECAGIDINLGCCAPDILRSGAGAAWLFNAEAAKAMVALVRKNVLRHRLSVKLRIGAADDFENLVSFSKMLQEEGVEQITLHPRTTKEKFKAYARWEYVEALKRELKIIVAGNGDIKTPKQLASVQTSNVCDAVMVGRLAVQKPWCFAEACGKLDTEIDLEHTALKFIEYLKLYQPQVFWYSRARRFFFYFCNNFKWAEYMRNELNRLQDIDQMSECLRKYFAENPSEKILRSIST
ncbi:MAG: tRNA-dihydrouridine synthase family protein [Termitinemataceae bacterium]|nr:MAG: tRNA-dihydrouridine synthase family protein [Termitinemataceae bacterium]